MSGRNRRLEVPSYRSALTERARRGDIAAFDELYRLHRDRVYALCLGLCGDRDSAEDLLQETFVKAWRALWRFESRASFATWVHRIAVNACRDAARRHRRQADEGAAAPPVDSSTVDQVRATLAELRPPYRVVLALHYTLGLSYEEISKTLGWSLAKVKVTIHRARRAFRKAYVEGVEQ